MTNYEAAIKRPFKDLKKLIIGIVLQIIPIVNFISMGYQLNCAKSAMDKRYGLPEWENWGGLFVRGLKSVVIGFVYGLPALIVMMISGGAALTSIMSGKVSPGLIFGSMGIGLMISFLLGLIAFYFVPSGIMSFLSKEDFSAAFSLGEVFSKAVNVDYLVVWIVAALYSMILTMILSLIPIIGAAAGSFISGVTYMTLFGEIYPTL